MLIFWDQVFMPGSPQGGGGAGKGGPRAGTPMEHPDKYWVTPGLRPQNETWAMTMRHLRSQQPLRWLRVASIPLCNHIQEEKYKE